MSPSPLRRSFRKKTVKIEDEFKECPHCQRKFGPKVSRICTTTFYTGTNGSELIYSQPFDRHVEWCGEKSRRLQASPTKDLVALAKLHARTRYRPRTPVKKEDSPSRKISFSTACDSPLPPSVLGDMEYQSQFGNGSRGNSVSRSESRNSFVQAGRRSSQERKMSNIRLDTGEELATSKSHEQIIECFSGTLLPCCKLTREGQEW